MDVSRPSRPMNSIEWGLLLLLSLLWGGSFFFNSLALRELPVLVIVVARTVLAALLLVATLYALRQVLPRQRAAWMAFLGMGCLNNAIPFTLIVWGQSHIASGVASILNATTPLFTVLVAHFLTSDERMTRGKLAGVVLGLAGVAVMIGGEALRNLGVNILAHLACLAAAISYAFAGVFGRRFKAMGITPMQTATGQVIASSLLLLPIVMFIERPWHLPMPGATTLLAVFGIAGLSTALAYVVFFRILASAGATNLALVTFLIPVSAILLGILFLGETLMLKHIAGMGLIGLGLAAIDGRLFAREPGRAPP